ncbi:MAG: hypothetical protein ACXAC5_24275 [Promethearchaeota archaeon]|jgi:hypothetical protein
MARKDSSANVSKEIQRTLESLPEELELTEPEWYHYHYYLQKNQFLVCKIIHLPFKAKNVYVLEPFETYIGNVLEAFGFQVYCEPSCKLQSLEFSGPRAVGKSPTQNTIEKEFDVILLLNILEYQQENPFTFLNYIVSLLKNNGKLFLTTENIVRFKNRIKILFGYNIFASLDGGHLSDTRKFSISELMEIFTYLKLEVQQSIFMNPYPPFKMEPLTVGRYLLKYINYVAMKPIPSFRDEIYIEAEKQIT